jgi:hypothetical protein
MVVLRCLTSIQTRLAASAHSVPLVCAFLLFWDWSAVVFPSTFSLSLSTSAFPLLLFLLFVLHRRRSRRRFARSFIP